jgi:hypothetical protein
VQWCRSWLRRRSGAREPEPGPDWFRPRFGALDPLETRLLDANLLTCLLALFALLLAFLTGFRSFVLIAVATVVLGKSWRRRDAGK